MRAQAAACFCAAVLDAFCHALQSPEAAAVFSPSLGVCLLLLIWGIAPGIETASRQASFPKTFLPEAFLVFTHRLICFLQLSLVCALKAGHGKKKACTIIFLHTFKSFARVRPYVQVRVCVRACVTCMR